MSAPEQMPSSAALAYLDPEIRKIFARPTTDIVSAGKVLGRGRNTAYRMAKDGVIPVIPGTGQVSTAVLARMVGLLPINEQIAA
jgi:hypothetical protein